MLAEEMTNEKIFPAGTPTRCNRVSCPGASSPQPLPRDMRAWQENSKCWRLAEMCVLPCGHMDSHWVFESDLLTVGDK